MTCRYPTYRFVDDERIPGIWRHAFVRNGDRYHLTALRIYADGMIDCWGLVTLEEFGERLRSGWIATEIEEGTTGEVTGLFTWVFTRARTYTRPEWLLAEVRDEVERLNDRPGSTERCLEAVKAFLTDQSDINREIVHAAYLEVPPSLHHTVVGVEALIERLADEAPEAPRLVDEPDRAWALSHYTERFAAADAATYNGSAGEEKNRDRAISIHPVSEWPDDPGPLVLCNEYPVPLHVGELWYPTVTHAFCSLSTDDPELQDAIRLAENVYQACQLAREAPTRAHWADCRLAVMLKLLRAKYRQHPTLAEELLGTGDAPLYYNDSGHSHYWGENRGDGRNWMGRLLEVIRAELHAERSVFAS